MLAELRDWWRSLLMKDPVRGAARVMADSDGGRRRVSCLVSGPGVRSTTVERRVRAGVKPGDDLPITVDRADPTRLRVEWRELQARRPGASTAGGLAGLMGGDEVSGAAQPAPVAAELPMQQSVLTIDGRPITTASRTIVMVNGRRVDAGEVTGIQEDISRIVAGGLDGKAMADAVRDLRARIAARGAGISTVTTTAAGAEIGTAARLHELEALRAAGQVTEEEYAQKRKQILDAL